ncbi:hypothetical protein [Clostridium botulinum]|uniref:Uncharacterized protein n=1 Tax=Clostridium botulinum TaxID=1491 RepID=A0A1L7JMW6_CLOBO|nr:hypothetical protein [Clostridium botulinum]APU87039.1 hypothetical protein NPD8_3925 [Clostridium botulinum]
MEMKLFKKDNELWTRFKIFNKYLDSIPAIAIKLYAKNLLKLVQDILIMRSKAIS